MDMRPWRDWAETATRLWWHPRIRREALLAFQRAQLRSLLRHAYAQVPFYRRLFDEAGCRPDSVERVEQLSRLPLTDKRSLRAAGPAVVCIGSDGLRLIRHLTSGSTGEPAEIRRSSAEENLLSLFRLRAHRQWGARARDRMAVVREPPLEGGRDTLAARAAHAASLYRRKTVSCLQPAAAIARELEGLAPDLISGYPSALGLVADEVSTGGRAQRIRPRLLAAGGEPLEPGTRDRVEAAFGAPLYDLYAAHECNLIAWQCPRHHYLHVNDDSVALEILSQGLPVGEGEVGEVVLTSLHSRVMPFIRYRLGDLAVRGPAQCPCGQPFSTLATIVGRTAHYLRLPGGRSVHPFAITGALLERDRAWVDRHQMVQEARDKVVLRIEPRRPPRPGELTRVEQHARRVLGPKTRFRIELVETLATEPGKFRSYRSLLDEQPPEIP